MDISTSNLVISKPNTYFPTDNKFRPLITPKIAEEQSGKFAFALAHEVRNPLTNINLAVEMLKSTSIEEERTQYLDIIVRSSNRVNALVSDFLKSFEIQDIQLESYAIHELLDEVLIMNKDRILLKNITVIKDYNTFDDMILVNKERIMIALTNIIINAIDAMSPSNGKLGLVTKAMNGKCRIEIEDNGIGISEENLKNIFKPYFTKKSDGMGLGLSATLDILLSNHAKIYVQSEEGRGTVFTIDFDQMRKESTPIS